MKITASNIPDILVFEPTIYCDDRGYFMETWRQSVFDEQGIDAGFVLEADDSSWRVRPILYDRKHDVGAGNDVHGDRKW